MSDHASHDDACPACGYSEPRIPWYVDEEKAEELSPAVASTNVAHKTQHKYKDIYHSTPYHKEWAVVQDALFRTWPANPRLAIEQLSFFLQAAIGTPGLEQSASSQFLSTLTWPTQPGDEELAMMAMALDHVLASNGGKGATITLARTQTGYPEARAPLYVRFQKDVADTDVAVPRYPDGDRSDVDRAGLDSGLVRAIHEIHRAAADPPVEVELALESCALSADLHIGVDIRQETTLDELYRRQR